MTDSGGTLETMADEVFDLYRLVAIARSRAPSSKGDLSETEFLALDALIRRQPQTIGEVQKAIGVVPAQMSRIVRSLEAHGGKGLVACEINPSDRRRVNLVLTGDGEEAYEHYRLNRRRSMLSVLQALREEDREEFMRMLRQLRGAFVKRLGM